MTPAPETAKETTWIAIELVGEDEKPIAGEPYKIVLPDGETVDKGTLDMKGQAKLTGIDPGSCQIGFPKLDKEAWTEI